MMTDQKILILGAGHGGGTIAAMLRQGGFGGDIVMIGEELVAPYQRPPLSKAYLKGTATLASLKLKADHFYHDQNIGTRFGATAEAIDPAAKQIRLDHGETLAYDILIIATGSRPRQINLPGSDLEGLHVLRNVADAEALKPVMESGRRIAMIGGGYIGLEAAASTVSLGGSAVVLERESRLLARVASEPLSSFFQDYHRSRGVEIRTGAQVAALEGGDDGFIVAVRLADGSRVPCDAALLCVGGLPNEEIARAAGLVCDGGIVVDLEARTSDPSIFAIGDVTRRPLPLYDNRMFRLESVPNVLEQAKQVTAAILGKPAPPPEVPWFWSDQFDIKLQIAGLPFDADRTVVRGDPASGKFAAFFLKGDLLLCVEAVNSPTDFMGGRLLIGQKSRVSAERLADLAIPIKAAVLA